MQTPPVFGMRGGRQLNDLTKNLTPAQLAAVQYVDGPLLILAGPGSGKTRVITHRVAYMLQQGVPARQILALTFTNKAADEMKSRVAVLTGGSKVWMSTFHRFCSRLLREYAHLVGLEQNFTIYDTGDSKQVMKRALTQVPQELAHYGPDRLSAAISTAKNNLITAEEYQARPGNPLGSVVARVYPAYQQQLLRSNAVDFDDLLLHTATLLKHNPEIRASLDARYRYIMVDEYQDTNLAQYMIVRALSIDHPNLAATGDPDQSIYGWRGANVSNILEFEHDYPEVQIVKLEQNYRSTKRILRAAGELIEHNVRRKKKGLFTENEEGAAVRCTTYSTHRDEAESIAARILRDVTQGVRRPRDFAIFYRTNALSRALEEALGEAGIPFQMVHGVEFYQRKEIKDLLAYLLLLNNPRDDNAFLRIINVPARGIGKVSLDRLAAHASRRGISLVEAARQSALVEGINQRAAVAIAKFVAMYDKLSMHVSGPVEETLGLVLAETAYRQQFEGSEDEQDISRLANIDELLTGTREFDERNPGSDHLEEFLEGVSLVNDIDDWTGDTDRVTMMTLHASKGLEFPVVFIVGVEQNLIPHERSLQTEEQYEEERRLLFVGMTRAMHELYLSTARYRMMRGRSALTVPSPFLMELPADEVIFEVDAAASGVPWETTEGDSEADEFPFGANSFEPDEEHSPAHSSPPARKTTAKRGLLDSLGTAADLLPGARQTAMNNPAAETFHQGMQVEHPTYGRGEIIAMGGAGQLRNATVRFQGQPEAVKFILRMSQLRPL